jgi:hypothetical protein
MFGIRFVLLILFIFFLIVVFIYLFFNIHFLWLFTFLLTDFGVGSYRSGMAVVLRSRPLISIEPTIHFAQNPIPLNSSGLGCAASNDFPCLEIQVCFNLTGRGILSSTCMFLFK